MFLCVLQHIFVKGYTFQDIYFNESASENPEKDDPIINMLLIFN